MSLFCPFTSQNSLLQPSIHICLPIKSPESLVSSQIIDDAAAAKSLQLCPTLCDPIDGSPPGAPSLGFSRQEHWSGLPFPSPMHESELAQSCPTLCDPPWTAAHQASLSLGLSRQEYWSGVPIATRS